MKPLRALLLLSLMVLPARSDVTVGRTVEHCDVDFDAGGKSAGVCSAELWHRAAAGMRALCARASGDCARTCKYVLPLDRARDGQCDPNVPDEDCVQNGLAPFCRVQKRGSQRLLHLRCYCGGIDLQLDGNRVRGVDWSGCDCD